jgi:hypothetical protein
MTKSRGILMARTVWTDDQVRALQSRYPTENTEAIAVDLGIGLRRVYQKAARLGLTKSPEYLATPAACRTNGRQGVGTRFEKGLTPWNKGKAFDSGGRSPETRFKAGQAPHNTKPVGSYRINKDGSLQQKIGDAKGNNSARWRGVHELVWISANGPRPPGHIVVFKPGMKTHTLTGITTDTVECISFAENMRRNTLHNMPKELTELVQLRGAITRQINKRAEK